MTKFNKENKGRAECVRMIEYHVSQASRDKKIYESTKNRKWFYKVFNTIALRLFGYHRKKAEQLWNFLY